MRERQRETRSTTWSKANSHKHFFVSSERNGVFADYVNGLRDSIKYLRQHLQKLKKKTATIFGEAVVSPRPRGLLWCVD